MQFAGIDPRTNKFTCCYRNENSPLDGKDGKLTGTFELTGYGLAAFYQTLTPETYVLIEATNPAFSFVRLIQPLVKEAIAANTYELKQTSPARKKTGKTGADKLRRILKTRILSGEQAVSAVTVPPTEIQELRALFSACRLYRKQAVQYKNRIRSLLKENLCGFTREEIFDKKNRETIWGIAGGAVLSCQTNDLPGLLENLEVRITPLQDRIKELSGPCMREIEILAGMKGAGVFIAAAVIADIIRVGRFKDSKSAAPYLRSAPGAAASNTSAGSRGTSRKGRKMSAALITQSLNHVLKASPKLNKRHARLAKYRKTGLVGTAPRRRVFAEIYQMLKKEEYHYDRDVRNHEAKLLQYRKFLEKRKVFLETA